MATQQNEQDPWVEDKEPPPPQLNDWVDSAPEARRMPPIFTHPKDSRDYVERMTPRTVLDAEEMLLLAQFEFETACEDAVATSLGYTDLEAQQARTRVRVIEKLMAESEASVSRKQSEAKRGDTLSVSAAEKIVSGHPEYTQIRDAVAEALNLKTEAEWRARLAEQRVLTLREILQNRRTFGSLLTAEQERALARNPRESMTLRPDEKDVIAQRDSRGLDGRERVSPPRQRFGTPEEISTAVSDSERGLRTHLHGND